MDEIEKRRQQAREGIEQRRKQEKEVEYEREAMRRMNAPQWAIALRMEQIKNEQ